MIRLVGEIRVTEQKLRSIEEELETLVKNLEEKLSVKSEFTYQLVLPKFDKQAIARKLGIRARAIDDLGGWIDFGATSPKKIQLVIPTPVGEFKLEDIVFTKKCPHQKDINFWLTVDPKDKTYFWSFRNDMEIKRECKKCVAMANPHLEEAEFLPAPHPSDEDIHDEELVRYRNSPEKEEESDSSA